PAGFMNSDSFPSTLHFRMRLFGWSVKKILPALSQVGPSVKLNSCASRSSFAPGAMTLDEFVGVWAINGRIVPSNAVSKRGEVFISLGMFFGNELHERRAKARPRKA